MSSSFIERVIVELVSIGVRIAPSCTSNRAQLVSRGARGFGLNLIRTIAQVKFQD